MIITCDFETFYSDEYSLSKLSEVEYILDTRFECIMCAIKEGNDQTQVYVGREDVARKLGSIDWTKSAMLSHNIRFDGAIAKWRFGVKPKLYLDTLSMARALTHVRAGGSSLKHVAKYLDLPDKGDDVIRAKGKRLKDFSPPELLGYMAYCQHDTDLCRLIFDHLRPAFPNSEIELVDMTARMFIEPTAFLAETVLSHHYGHLVHENDKLQAAVSTIPKDVFSSNQKFAALLESEGVDVPMKVSPVTGKTMPALAIGDRAFKELLADDTQTPWVQALLAARVGAKSTIEMTRTYKMLKLARIRWGTADPGIMPVPLKYYGAHTGRFSGDGGFNFQNLKSGSAIKQAIHTHNHMRIVHRDSSQIEARMVAWLSGCRTLLDAFIQKRDVYSEFATDVYGRTVTAADKGDRFVGKTSILGLGYGMGATKFQHTLFIGNRGMSLKIPLKESSRVVSFYRSKYHEIPDLWKRADILLEHMIVLGGEKPKPGYGMRLKKLEEQPIPALRFTADTLWLPNDMPLQYPGLRYDDVPDEQGRFGVVYDGGKARGKVHLFGGKVIENISQAYARIVITDIARTVHRETGYRPTLTTHDSLDYVVPEREVTRFHSYLGLAFAVPPKWARDLPLASQGGWGVTLAGAETEANT